jgi:archaellum component FlaC
MDVERGDWTDARLDDRFDQIDGRFDQIDRRFDRVDAELMEMRGDIRGVRTEINDLRTTFIRFNAGIMVGLLGVIAAILARGA